MSRWSVALKKKERKTRWECLVLGAYWVVNSLFLILPTSAVLPAPTDILSLSWSNKAGALTPQVQFSSVQLLSCVRLFTTPWTAACQASLSITNSRTYLKLVSIESVLSSNHLILCCLLLLPSIFSSIRVPSNESVLRIRWPKYWSFSFSLSPSNEYSGLISFRMDWLDLLAAQGTLKSILQHLSSKASIFGFQLSLYSNLHIHTWPLDKL